MAEVERSYSRFVAMGVRVVAANSDGDRDTDATSRDHNLSFPVAHSVGEELAQALGAWVGVRRGRKYIQPVEFVIRPNAEVAASLYATTQLGRMDPEEVLRFIEARKD